MEDQNPSLSPNTHIHANATNNPFMQDLPFPYGTSLSYVLNNDSAVQNHTSWNHTLVAQETPESFVPPRIPHYYQGSGSGSGSGGLEDLESAIGGLSLSYPFRNSTPSVGQSSGSNGFEPNNFLSQPIHENSGSNGSGYVHDREILSLLRERIAAAATEQRVLAASYSRSVPNCSNSMSNRYLNHQMSNGISNMPHGDGVNGLGNGFEPNNFLSQPVYENSGSNGSGYVHDTGMLSLLRERIAAAAAAEQRVLAASYSRSVPNCSNSMSNRYLNHQMSNGISNMPHGDGVNGLGNYYDDHCRLNTDRPRPILRSPLHSNHGHGSSLLEGMRGEVVSMAKDRSGCRFLQFMIDEGPEEIIEMVLSEVKDHMHDLMTHQFGNYLIKKIFESSRVSDDNKNFIVDSIIQDVHKLRHVCMDNHGTRVIQIMLENVKTLERMDEVTNVMKQITVPLMKNVNGGYVIQQCVKVFPTTYQLKILYVVAFNCIDIATNRSGCSFIQKCMGCAQLEAKVPLVEAIICNAAVLAEDPYGNYVVNYLVKLEMLNVNGMIVSELQFKYVELSRNKHASNVVQRLLKCSEEKDAEIIILELMNNPEFCSVLQDPYGNYVAQTALEISKGYMHKRLLESILAKYGCLRSHLYGKKVLSFIAKGRKIQF